MLWVAPSSDHARSFSVPIWPIRARLGAVIKRLSTLTFYWGVGGRSKRNDKEWKDLSDTYYWPGPGYMAYCTVQIFYGLFTALPAVTIWNGSSARQVWLRLGGQLQSLRAGFCGWGVMLRRWYGTITDLLRTGLGWSLGAVYIDVSFPWPSSSPWLDILVNRLPIVQACRPSCRAHASIDWVANSSKRIVIRL